MPWSSTRPAGSRTQPIYRTAEHKRARARLLAAYQPGDLCCLCGHPMWPEDAPLHADHVPGSLTEYRGLAHGTKPCQTCGQRCNVRDGARRGNQRSRDAEPESKRWEL